MRPMTRRDPETADPMHVEAALRAVEDEVLELALEIGLHAQAGVPVLMGAAWTCTCGPTVPLYSCQPCQESRCDCSGGR
jgi:hypothetical protein